MRMTDLKFAPRLASACTLMLLLGTLVSSVNAAESRTPDEDWKALERALELPQPPEAWQRQAPGEAELAAFRAERAELLVKLADQARSFYTVHSTEHAKAEQARDIEFQALQLAVRTGRTNVLARVEALENTKLAEPGLSEDERFGLRQQQVERFAMITGGDDRSKVIAEFVKGLQGLLKEFPKRTEIWATLIQFANQLEPAVARTIAEDALKARIPDQIKSEAQTLKTRLSFVGKPLDLKFTAVDGREVDLSKMRGKVVLVDFWATWCGPCIAALPELKAAYSKLNSKGFEIIGISLDRSKDSLQQFVKREQMTWPHYFDGLHWDNKISKKHGITSIPATWLVDKKGVLRQLNTGASLEKAVEALLAEE